MRLGTRTRVMVDSNVWISGFLCNGNEMSAILELILRNNDIIVCKTILEEVRAILATRFQIEPESIDQILDLISDLSTIWEERLRTDPFKENDLRIFDTAVRSSCDFFLTCDKFLLRIKSFGKLEVMTPRSFLLLIK